jgi:hypothetical protein
MHLPDDPLIERFSNSELLAQNNLDASEITKPFLLMNESDYDVNLPLSSDEAILELKKRFPR